MVGRDELTIDLATKFSKKSILEFLEVKRKILRLQKLCQLAREKHKERLNELGDEIIKLKFECKHPHTYLTSGGQYEPQEEICSICDSEL